MSSKAPTVENVTPHKMLNMIHQSFLNCDLLHFCIEMSGNLSEHLSLSSWLVYLDYYKRFQQCSNPDTLLILRMEMLPVSRLPVAITSGKVTDWRMKSAKELFKTCYIWALVQQQLSPIQGCVCVCCDATKSPIFSCLCLVPTTISFHIFHLITSVFLFISLVQLSLCSLDLNRTEPVSCGFVSLSLIHSPHFISFSPVLHCV